MICSIIIYQNLKNGNTLLKKRWLGAFFYQIWRPGPTGASSERIWTDFSMLFYRFTWVYNRFTGSPDPWILRDFDQEKIGVSGNFKSLILRIHGSSLSLLLISGLRASSNHVKSRVVDSLGGPYRGPKNQKFVVLREVGPIRFARAKAWIYAIASWVL